jgi:hypothetical protein
MSRPLKVFRMGLETSVAVSAISTETRSEGEDIESTSSSSLVVLPSLMGAKTGLDKDPRRFVALIAEIAVCHRFRGLKLARRPSERSCSAEGSKLVNHCKAF